MLRGIPIAALIWFVGCTPCPCPPAAPSQGAAPRVAVIPQTDEERRYAEIRADRPGTASEIRLTLIAASDGGSPILRNAAARALLDRGVEDAARWLIQNLHRDQRTFVVTDAIYHLREVFGTDLGYEPNEKLF